MLEALGAPGIVYWEKVELQPLSCLGFVEYQVCQSLIKKARCRPSPHPLLWALEVLKRLPPSSEI